MRLAITARFAAVRREIARRRSLALEQAEAGFTLIETLIYMVLAVLIFGIVGSILINGLRVESIVRTANTSSDAGQLVIESVQRGIRNSTTFTIVVPEGRDKDQAIIARVAGADPTLKYSCQAWYYSDTEHTVRTRTGPDGTAISLANPLSWTLLGEGVAPGDTGKVFAATTADLTLDFTMTATDRAPIKITGLARPWSNTSEPSACS